MTTLKLNYEACVRSLSMLASCTRCRDVCPTTAVTLHGVRDTVVVHLSRCTDCGLCAAECPTDAFVGPFDVGAFVASCGPELRCGQDGLPCVGALSTEDLIAVAARHKQVILHDDPCEARDPGHERARTRIEQAQRFANAVGLRSTLTWVAAADLTEPQPEAPSRAPVPTTQDEVSAGRRRLLRMFVPPLPERDNTRIVHPERLDRALMQRPTLRRKRLLAALPSSVEAAEATLEASGVGFFSSKEVSAETCTACSVCISVCPTGALQAPRSLREIRFDTSRCTKCQLCHDVCAPKAITVAAAASVSDFLDFAPRRLTQLSMAACTDCGVSYRRRDPNQSLCPACQDMEQEALELFGGSR